MKTSGLFRVHSHEVKVRSNEPLHLVIFGDVHRDSPNHAEGAWKDFLVHARGLKHALFLGMGDYVDSASSSERACLDHAKDLLHETTRKDLAELADAKVKLLARELSFTRGKLIGLLNGNHWFHWSDDTNTDQRLCRELDTTYLGVSCFIRLYLKPATGGTYALDIWAHHGAGAGRLMGGSINRVDQMREHAEADIYIMGHDHKRMAVPATPRLSLVHNGRAGLEVKQRQQWLVRSGSFLASYRDGESNYNVDAGRGPSSLGHVEIIITPRAEDKQSHVNRFDINALV